MGLWAAKFVKWASCKIQYLELFNGMMKLRNGGSIEWQNILRCRMTIYYYKSLEKWICNEMKKLFPINRQNSKKGNVIIVEAQGIEKPWGFWANSFKLLSCYHYYHYKYYYLLPLQSLVECQWENIFLNHLSLVEQGTYKYVGCGSFSALHVRQTFCNTTSCIIIQPPVLFNAINVVLCQ